MSSESVVFIVSRNGNPTHRRVLWLVPREDAMKICSDDRTAGKNFMLCFDKPSVDDPEFGHRFIPDNGRFAAVLADHNITVLRCYADGTRTIAA